MNRGQREISEVDLTGSRQGAHNFGPNMLNLAVNATPSHKTPHKQWAVNPSSSNQRRRGEVDLSKRCPWTHKAEPKWLRMMRNAFTFNTKTHKQGRIRPYATVIKPRTLEAYKSLSEHSKRGDMPSMANGMEEGEEETTKNRWGEGESGKSGVWIRVREDTKQRNRGL